MDKDNEKLLQRLAHMKKEFARKQRQYSKSVSLSRAKAHVKQKLLEQENLRKGLESKSDPYNDKVRVSPHSGNACPRNTLITCDSSSEQTAHINEPGDSTNELHVLKNDVNSKSRDKALENKGITGESDCSYKNSPTSENSCNTRILNGSSASLVENSNNRMIATDCLTQNKTDCPLPSENLGKQQKNSFKSTDVLHNGPDSNKQDISAVSSSGSSLESSGNSGKRQLSLKRKRHSIAGSVLQDSKENNTRTKRKSIHVYQEIDLKVSRAKNRRLSDIFSVKTEVETGNTENTHGKVTGYNKSIEKSSQKHDAKYKGILTKMKSPHSVQKKSHQKSKKSTRASIDSVIQVQFDPLTDRYNNLNANRVLKQTSNKGNHSTLQDGCLGTHKSLNKETDFSDTTSETLDNHSVRHDNISPAESQELDTLILLQESYSIDPDCNTRKTRRSHHPFMLSSVFQFVIDEAKRIEKCQDFDLPLSSYGKLMKKKLRNVHKMLMSSKTNSSANLNQRQKDISSDIQNKSENKFDSHLLNPKDSQNILDSIKLKDFDKEKAAKITLESPLENVLHTVNESDLVMTHPEVLVSSCRTEINAPDPKCDPGETLTSDNGRVANMNSHFPQISLEKINGDIPNDNGSQGLIAEYSLEKTNQTLLSLSNNDDCTHSVVNLDNVENPQEISETDEPASTCDLSDTEEHVSGDQIQHICSVQFPDDEPLISLDVWTKYRRRDRELLVCLCETSLTLWSLHKSSLICLQKWSFSKGQRGVRGTLLASKSSKLVYAVVLSDGHCTTLHIAQFEEDQGHSLFKVIELPSDSCHLCGVGNTEILIGDNRKTYTQITKYTLDMVAKCLSNTSGFEIAPGLLDSLHPVQGLPAAIIGYVAEGLIHIWNHEIGSLLVTVNMAVFWSYPSMIVSVTYEKGFLFVSQLKKTEGGDAGCVMLINPTNCQTKVLHTYQSKLWRGCTDTYPLQDYSAGLDKNGTLCMWDIFTGEIVSRSRHSFISAICRFKNKFFIGHKHCLHLFQR